MLPIKYGVPLTKYQCLTFYTPEDPHGYINYPTATLSQPTGTTPTIIPRARDVISSSTLVTAVEGANTRSRH